MHDLGKGGTEPADDYIFLFSSVAVAMRSIHFLTAFFVLKNQSHQAVNTVQRVSESRPHTVLKGC